LGPHNLHISLNLKSMDVVDQIAEKLQPITDNVLTLKIRRSVNAGVPLSEALIKDNNHLHDSVLSDTHFQPV
jgi:hypothetical protein